MGPQERICRICLKICDKYKAIEGDVKDILDVVLPKMDSTVIQKLVMCTDCTKMLSKCFDFKAACLYTHDYLIPFINNEEDVKLDLKDVFLRDSENGIGVPEDQDICGFCMDPVKNCSAISLDIEEGDTVKKMIERCLPELDISIINKPVICTTCRYSLEECSHFVTNYLTIEGNIKKEDLDIGSKLELSSLLQSTTRDGAINEVDGNLVDKIKVEKQYYKQREDADEGKTCSKGDLIKLEPMICEKGNLAEMGDQKYLVSEEIEIKTDQEDFNRFEGAVLLPQSEVTTRLRRRGNCVVPNLDGDLSNPHVKHPSTKENAKKMRMFRCDYCSFQTKTKQHLKRHSLCHKDPSEITMYQCDFCSLQTKRKDALKRHILHCNDSSKMHMYKCDSCSFQTGYKYGLKVHSLRRHKDSSEVTMYQCSSCSYQTRIKGYLKEHSLRHKDPSEVTVYRCDSCSFMTKRKRDLKVHSLCHKDSSEVTIYQCHSCSYQTHKKYSLQRHMLLFKDSDMHMYKCDSCSYQTQRKDVLKKHILVHMDSSKLGIYKCASCLFHTRRKDSLKRHILRCKDFSKMHTYK